MLGVSACDFSEAKPAFTIDGTPNPLYYGGTCSTPVLTLLVSGYADGATIEKVTASYQLFDGSGTEIHRSTFELHPIPGAPPFAYDTDRLIDIPDPDTFGNGSIKLEWIVNLTLPDRGGTFALVGAKIIPVLPCPPKPVFPTIDPGLPPAKGTLVPPDAPDKPEPSDDEGAPPAPPSCSTEPNNPSCVNP